MVRMETVMGPTAGVHPGLGSAGPQAACCMSLAVPGEWGPGPPSFYRGYKAPKWQCQDLNQALWCHLCLDYHVVLGGPPRTGGASSSHRAERQARPGQAPKGQPAGGLPGFQGRDTSRGSRAENRVRPTPGNRRSPVLRPPDKAQGRTYVLPEASWGGVEA